MAFEQLKRIAGRATAGVGHRGHGAREARHGGDDRLGHPALIEIDLYEERPIARRRVVAAERVAIDVTESVDTRIVRDERGIEHIEIDREGPDNAHV